MPLIRAIAALLLATLAPRDTAPALRSAQRGGEITGARLTIVEKTAPQLEVTIENRREVSLVEWRVTAGRTVSSRWGAIAPHARGTLWFSADDQTSGGPPAIVVAVFADGSFEGVGPEFEAWLKARRDRADDLGYWVRALTSMPRVSQLALRKYLTDALVERTGYDKSNVEHVSDRVREILRRFPDGPDIWPPLDELKKRIEAEFILASRQSSQAATAQEVTGAVIVSTQETETKKYAVAIENLRDVPIEAVGFDELDADGRARGSQGSDFCLADPADRTSGHGRIQPHERREFRVFPQPGTVPRHVLSFVLFDDLSFEGRVEARDDILRRRTELGYEYAFAVETLKTVDSISPRGLEAFLNGRRTEWARQLEKQGKQPGTGGPLDEALRQVRESPERFMAGATAYRAVIEQQLTRLRRHLPPGGIAGARLTIVDKSTNRLVVTIENQRDSPLVEWRVDSPWTSIGGRDIVAPHQRREVSIEIQDDRAATPSPKIELAAFADGYYEGRGRMFDQWVAQRNERREDCAYWVKAFMSLPRISDVEARKALAGHVAARAGRESQMIPHVSYRVQALLNQVPEGPELWPPLDRLRKEIDAEYLAVTKVPVGEAPSGTVERVTAATVVSAELRPATSYSLVIENLRDAPIEAFGIQEIDLPKGRFAGGSSSDFVAGDPAETWPRNERIPPHEKRDLGAAFGPRTIAPAARLWFVMFDDLQFEGDPAQRVELLRHREARADEMQAALAALDDASGPAAGLDAFFVARRQAYVAQLQRDGKSALPGGSIESFLRTIRQSSAAAERFVADMPATRTRLQGQIARLRRHLSSVGK